MVARLSRIVLLVDGDEENALALKAALRHSQTSLAVVAVPDGVSAINYLSSTRDDRYGDPVAVITGVNLVPGDGFYLLEWLRNSERWGSLPVIVLTASDLEADRNRAKELGATAYYNKGSPKETRNFLKDLGKWL